METGRKKFLKVKGAACAKGHKFGKLHVGLLRQEHLLWQGEMC